MESRRFSRNREDFVCYNCGFKVHGTGYTDHCPNCLWGKHVDINPGDRKAGCHGKMKPIGAIAERDSIVITYKCMKCGLQRRFKAAAQDNKEKLYALLSQNKKDKRSA